MRITKAYYYFLGFVVVYFIFTIGIRDVLINYFLDIDPNESVKNAELYHKENAIRTVLTYVMLVALIVEFIFSVILLFYREHGVPKLLLAVISLLILLLFAAIYAVGGFS